jgi:peptidoglycan-associated lipoprotein
MKNAVLLAFTIVAAALIACSRSQQVATPAPTPPAPQPNQDSIAAVEQAARDSALAAEREREEAERLAQQRAADSAAQAARADDEARAVLTALIHFDYDKSAILPEAATLLDKKAAILWSDPEARIRIAGHCDERGSDEYNLALGNRRAASAKAYLLSRGVATERIDIISYGEERPLDPGHTADAWAKNRRNEFDIVAGKLAITPP